MYSLILGMLQNRAFLYPSKGRPPGGVPAMSSSTSIMVGLSGRTLVNYVGAVSCCNQLSYLNKKFLTVLAVAP